MTRLSWFPSITLHHTRSGGELGHNSAFGWWVLSPKWWRDNNKAKDVSWAGTAAQEQYEHVWRRIFAPILWLPLFFPVFGRWLEIMGHAVEIVVARGDSEQRHEGAYIGRMAHTLRENYSHLFGHLAEDKIDRAIVYALPRAERWVARHPRFIANLRKWEKL